MPAEKDVRRTEPGVQTNANNPLLRAQPHRVPAFWRLFGLFQRQSRPIAADSAWDERDDIFAAHREWERLISLGTDRIRRYDIFDEMDNFGLVSSILNVYAEEATQKDYDRGVRVWVESEASHMIEGAKDCFQNLQMEDRIFAISRRMGKYGDAFQRMLYATEKGVLGWRIAKAHNIHRIEDKYGRLVGFKEEGAKFRKALHPGGNNTSFPWDYVHFRMLGKNEEDGYGTGHCENFFREWRYMTLTEDSMLMYRLRRTPDRNLVLVDVGQLEDHEAMHYVNRWRKRLRKTELVDPSAPDYKKQYNPLTPLEDIFLPIRGDKQTRVETLAGSGNIGDVADLEHFRDAFFGAAAAPKAYFGFEGEINAKATLQQQDVRFARGLKRQQQATIFGVRQALDIHFTLLRTPESGNKWDFSKPDNAYMVQMSPISYLDEFERLELIQMRYQLVESMSGLAGNMSLDARVWAIYVLLNFAKLPEEMVQRLISQVPNKPAAGGGEGFESLTAEQRAQILDNEGKSKQGFFPLSKPEMKAICEAVHTSPGLRQRIANFAELGEQEKLDRMLQQTDPSLLPVIAGGQPLQDTYEDDPKIKPLMEDLDLLKKPADELAEILTERHGGELSPQVVVAGAAVRQLSGADPVANGGQLNG